MVDSTNPKPTSQSMRDFMQVHKVKAVLNDNMLRVLHDDGYNVIDDYALMRVYQGYQITIEFSVEGFIVGLYSKKTHILLEKAENHKYLLDALMTVTGFLTRIDCGEHWDREDE